MSQVDLKDRVIATLQKILAEIEACDALPDPTSLEAMVMGKEWNVKFDTLTDLKQKAIHVTTMLLPSDVQEVVSAIEQSVYKRQMNA